MVATMRIEMPHSGQCCVTELRPVDWFRRPHDRMTISTSFQANIRLRINKNRCAEPGYLFSKDSARFRDQTGQLPSLKPVWYLVVAYLALRAALYHRVAIPQQDGKSIGLDCSLLTHSLPSLFGFTLFLDVLVY